jgi:hypothetical protein
MLSMISYKLFKKNLSKANMNCCTVFGSRCANTTLNRSKLKYYIGSLMKRDEAVTTLREISEACKDMYGSAVSLEESKPDDESTGYKLCIKASFDGNDRMLVRGIAEKRNLAIKEEKDELVIYQPKL